MPDSPSPILDDSGRNWLEVVREYVESLRFGTVAITIQDGRVIQIEKTERLRFDKPVILEIAKPLNPIQNRNPKK